MTVPGRLSPYSAGTPLREIVHTPPKMSHFSGGHDDHQPRSGEMTHAIEPGVCQIGIGVFCACSPRELHPKGVRKRIDPRDDVLVASLYIPCATFAFHKAPKTRCCTR